MTCDRLDDAIEACRTTALDMHVHYKETSLAGLAVSLNCCVDTNQLIGLRRR